MELGFWSYEGHIHKQKSSTMKKHTHMSATLVILVVIPIYFCQFKI